MRFVDYVTLELTARTAKQRTRVSQASPSSREVAGLRDSPARPTRSPRLKMLRQLLSSRWWNTSSGVYRRLITGIASSSHTVEYTCFGEAVRSLANFHVKQKAATSLSCINSSQRKLSAYGSCRAVIHKPHRDRDSTTGREYHFKGREPSKRMLRAVYTRFNTLPPSLYTLDTSYYILLLDWSEHDALVFPFMLS